MQHWRDIKSVRANIVIIKALKSLKVPMLVVFPLCMLNKCAGSCEESSSSLHPDPVLQAPPRVWLSRRVAIRRPGERARPTSGDVPPAAIWPIWEVSHCQARAQKDGWRAEAQIRVLEGCNVSDCDSLTDSVVASVTRRTGGQCFPSGSQSLKASGSLLAPHWLSKAL